MDYTKEKWVARLGGKASFVETEDGRKLVADCQPLVTGRMSYTEVEANARLIAAAPDLLKACEAAAKLIAQCQKAIEANDLSLFPNEAQRLRAENDCWSAIADAKGEAPNK